MIKTWYLPGTELTYNKTINNKNFDYEKKKEEKRLDDL